MKKEDILKIENLKNDGNVFVIRWNMTRLCNYYCDFCVQGNKNVHITESKGESLKIRKEIADRLIKFIEEKLSSTYNHLRICLIGGEVTILPDFISILERLVNCQYKGKIDFAITTNLSTNENVLNELKRLFKNKQNRHLSISSSFYKEFTSEKDFIKKIKYLNKEMNLKHYLSFKEKSSSNFSKKVYSSLYSFVKKLDKRDSHILTTIGIPLAVDNDYELFLKFKKKYSKLVHKVHYIIIRDYKTSITDDLKNELSKNNDKVIKVTLKNGEVRYYTNIIKMGLDLEGKKFIPKGLYCDSGVHNISIGNLGDISRCSSCEKLTTVGNILNDDLDLLKDKIVCPSIRCNCNFYHSIEQIQK